MSEPVNGDLSLRAVAHTAEMQWTASPSGTVWRKRVHRVGPPESGQVTSLVRYEPASSFPVHDHPDGEEILVLDGVFSDEHGDWPAGTYLLNPEGFHHAPFSKDGCLLFVKLRQYPGRDRGHVIIDTSAEPWQPGDSEGVEIKPLYRQAGFSDQTSLERWAAGAELGLIAYEHGAELFVLDGEFTDEHGRYVAGSWLRIPSGAMHHPHSAVGCTVYLKVGGLPYLKSGVS